MKLIGITGGIGAGKSLILSYLQEHSSCRVLLADEAAHEVQEPGQPCYGALVRLLGQEVLQPDGRIDRQRMAARIFEDRALLAQVNAIVHPAVKKYILTEVEKERLAGKADYFFLEAALLIEDGYRDIVDELWYIYAPEELRRRRLQASRGYSEEKISHIMGSQLPDPQFRAACTRLIDNGGSPEDTYRQLDGLLKELRELPEGLPKPGPEKGGSESSTETGIGEEGPGGRRSRTPNPAGTGNPIHREEESR